MGGAITGAIIGILVGVIFLAIGIQNMKGNISMLHSYHINNIKEEDKPAFGRAVGLGMFIMAAALIVYGALFIPAELTGNGIYMTVGGAVLAVGLGGGIVLTLLAIKRYNGKIFG